MFETNVSKGICYYRLGRARSEYYSGGFGGHGNFYFTIDENEVKEAKLYSELFKNIHRSKPVPFKGQQISDSLCSKAMGQVLQEDLDTQDLVFEHVKEDCDSLLKVIHSIETSKTYYGRLELILGYTDDDVAELSFNGIIEAAEQCIQINSLLSPECYTLVKYVDVVNHLQTFLLPAVHHIRHLIQKVQAAQAANERIPYTLRDHLDTVVCEAAITFFIYGSAVSIKHRRGHCNDMLREIGWTAVGMRHKPIFNGFSRITVLPDRLEYTPSNRVRLLFPFNMKFDGVIYTLLEANQEFIATGNEDVFRDPWKAAILFCVDSILITANLCLKKTGSSLATTEVLPTVDYQRVRMQSCSEFIVWLYNKLETIKSGVVGQLANVLGIVLSAVYEDKYLEWKEAIAVELEGRMAYRRRFMCFVLDQQTVRIVLPFHNICNNIKGNLGWSSYANVLKRSSVERFRGKRLNGGRNEDMLWEDFEVAIVGDQDILKYVELRKEGYVDKLFVNFFKLWS